MNSDDFEKHLQRQPLRQIPQDWRADILQNATASTSLSRRSVAKADRPSFFSTLFWPNPKAWAGLAAVWIAIFALHYSSGQNSPQLAKRPSPLTSEMIASLKDQQRVLAELIGTPAPRDAEPPKRFSPQPHSERREATSMA